MLVPNRQTWYRSFALTAMTVALAATACSDQDKNVGPTVSSSNAGLSSSDDIKALYSAKPVSELMKEVVGLGPRIAGGPAEKLAAQIIQKRFERFGLSTTVENYPVPTFWKDKCGSQLTIKDAGIDPITMAAVSYSPPANITAKLIYVGLGYPEDFAKYAAGKTGYLAFVQRGGIPFAFKAQYALDGGAAGVVVMNNRTSSKLPALTAGMPPLPMANLSLEDGNKILQILYPDGIPGPTGNLTTNVVLNATLKVDTELTLGSSPQVIGTIQGTAPGTGTLYLTAELDSAAVGPRATLEGWAICPYTYGDGSVAPSPGANDDGTGLAAIVEAARVLSTGHRMKADVKFIASGGSELNTAGTLAYVAAHRNEVRSAGLGEIDIDMVGVGKYVLMGNMTSPPDLAVFGLAKAQAMGFAVLEPQDWTVDSRKLPAYAWGGVVIDAVGWLPQSSNHFGFEYSGVPSLALVRMIGEGPDDINFVDDPNFHSINDTLDKIATPLVEVTGELITGIVYDFAKNPARRVRQAALADGACTPPCKGI
jgi:hypothetical protein